MTVPEESRRKRDDSDRHRLFASASAFMLVMAAAFGAIAFVQSPAAPEPVQEASPVGEARACAGVCTAAAIGGALVVGGTAGYLLAPDVDQEAVNAADTEQAKIDLYSNGLSHKDQREVVTTAYDNYLEDSREVALMEGKNAYVRALQNESSQSVVEEEARSAVRDYYAKKQANLVRSFDSTMVRLEYMANVTEQESGMTSFFDSSESNGFIRFGGSHPSTTDDLGASEFVNETIQLVNGTEVEFRTFRTANYDSGHSQWGNQTVKPNGSVFGSARETSMKSVRLQGGSIESRDYDTATFLKFSNYSNPWSKAESEATTVGNNVETFISETFDQWAAGKIEKSDLVDPYMASRSYSPEGNYGAWALSSYQAMGLETPANMSNYGRFEVQDHKKQVELSGMLMSDGLPENDTFQVGQKYDAREISGLQYVITEDSTNKLEGNFTIENVTKSDGTAVTEVKYRNITYETADLTEFRNLSQDLQQSRAESEAWKQNELKNGTSSGGLIVPGFGTIGMPMLAAAIALLLALVLGLAAVFRS